MGKIKSTEEKEKLKWKPVEFDENWYEQHLQAEEENRIKKIKCPSCKSTSKEHIEKRNDNGIIGPGYSSWLVEEYFVCNKCGTMFQDINKLKKRK